MAVRAVKFMHGKKAMFYTILSVMFVGFAIVLLSSEQDTYKEMDELDLVRTRVYSMNDFTRDIEQDIERALYITGFRALASEIGYIIDFGEFVDDYDLRFKEAFFEGTVMNWSQALMTNSTFNDWLSRVQYQGNKKGIVMNITVTNVTIYHVTPWVVNVTGSFVINVSDSMSTAKWGREMQSTSQINIKGFEDPLYVIYSYGRVTNFINITPYSGDYTSGANATFDPGNLLLHTLNSLYTNNSNAPSFLMRLENNLSSSPYGIESLVNVGFFESQGAPVYDKSVVDYIYFSNSSDPASHQINEMPNWFRLDDAHLVLYQVDGETI